MVSHPAEELKYMRDDMVLRMATAYGIAPTDERLLGGFVSLWDELMFFMGYDATPARFLAGGLVASDLDMQSIDQMAAARPLARR